MDLLCPACQRDVEIKLAKDGWPEGELIDNGLNCPHCGIKVAVSGNEDVEGYMYWSSVLCP